MWNIILFGVIPYVTVAIAVVGGIWRYRTDRFSYSSQSSQFLESRALFWGSVAWHYGILFVLGAHIAALMFWDPWAALVSNPTRLYVLEVIGLSLSLLAFAGLALLIVRRLTVRRVKAVTTTMDWVLLVALAAQVATRDLDRARLSLGIAVVRPHGRALDALAHQAQPEAGVHGLPARNREAARNRRVPAHRPLPVHAARPYRDRARHVSLAFLPGRRVEPTSGAVGVPAPGREPRSAYR